MHISQWFLDAGSSPSNVVILKSLISCCKYSHSASFNSSLCYIHYELKKDFYMVQRGIGRGRWWCLITICPSAPGSCIFIYSNKPSQDQLLFPSCCLTFPTQSWHIDLQCVSWDRVHLAASQILVLMQIIGKLIQIIALPWVYSVLSDLG